MTSKEKFRRTHLKLAEYWETGNWGFTINKVIYYCPLCQLIKDSFFKSSDACLLSEICSCCTQRNRDSNCTNMRTYPGHKREGFIHLPRAEYHLRMAGFIKTQPPERFHRRNAIKGFPEAFEIDRETAEGAK